MSQQPTDPTDPTTDEPTDPPVVEEPTDPPVEEPPVEEPPVDEPDEPETPAEPEGPQLTELGRREYRAPGVFFQMFKYAEHGQLGTLRIEREGQEPAVAQLTFDDCLFLSDFVRAFGSDFLR